MSTITTGNLNLTKPEPSDVMRNTIGVDLPGNFDKIDSSYTELKSRVEQIISTPVESVNAQEIIDARGGNTVLNGRFVNIESDIDLLSDVNEIIVENNGYGILTGGTVTQSITPGMSVLVNVFNAHLYNNTKIITSEAITVLIDGSDTVNPRKDLIYLSLNGSVSYITGTPSPSPIIPTIPINCIPLAEINVLANVTSILNSNIVDIRKVIYTNDLLLTKINTKADNSDSNRLTSDKTVTGAINELNNKIILLSNPNLLINGDFQIWQRGTSFTLTSNQYTVDRWYNRLSNPSVASSTKDNDGFKSTCLIGNCVNILDYLMEEKSKFINKQLTISLSIDNEIHSYTFTLTSMNNYILISTFENKSYTFEIKDAGVSTQKTITVAVNHTTVGDSRIINWVKLELGINTTPFIPRLYGEELFLCQRYYETGGVIRGMIGGVALSRVNTAVFFKANKRVTPTMKIDPDNSTSINNTIRRENDSALYNVNLYGITTTSVSVIDLATTSGTNSGDTFVFKFKADAEIY